MPDVEYEAKLYDDRMAAASAIQRLESLGYDRANISLALTEADLPADQNFSSDASPLAARGGLGGVGTIVGATSGGVIGALVAGAASAALIAGTGGAAAPFLAGPIVAAIGGLNAGAIGGSIIGGLMELGVEVEDWHVGLRNGAIGVIVSLKSSADRGVVRNALMNW